MARSDALRIRNVVFPTDGSAWAEHAFDQAVFYAANHDATLHVVTVAFGRPTDAPVTAPPTGEALTPDDFRAKLRAAAAESVGLDLVLAEVHDASPVSGVLDYAARVQADLIVMSTHGRTGFDRVLAGSVAGGVVRRAACPVLTVRPTADRTPAHASRLLVPTDFSDVAYLAAAHAVALSHLHGAHVDLVHVVEPEPGPGITGEMGGAPEPDPVLLDDAKGALRDLTAEVGFADAPVGIHSVIDRPADGILTAADELGADLIVMGSHGRTGLSRALIGSVAERVVAEAPCPVLTFNARAKALLPASRARQAASG